MAALSHDILTDGSAGDASSLPRRCLCSANPTHTDTPMPLPPDVARIIDDIDDIEARVRRLTEPLTPSQLNWQPDGGRGWSIAQCLDHLRVTGDLYLPALEEAAALARERGWKRRGPLELRGLLARWFVRQLEPPPRRRLRAPAKMQPASILDPEAVLAGYFAALHRYRAFVQETADLDLHRVRYRNPAARNLRIFTVAAGLFIMAAHERRHVWQAEQVRQAPGFPS